MDRRRIRWRSSSAIGRFLLIPVVVTTLLLASPTPATAAGPFAGAPGVGDAYYPDDGNGGYDVTHYDIALDYRPATHVLTGRAKITATATRILTSFNLDFSGPDVSRVLVDGRPAAFTRHGEHELTVSPAFPLLPRSTFLVHVEYAGVPPDTRGKGWTYSADGGAFASGQPHGAATWYPLNDTPRDKATFAVTATVPKEYEVVSIGLRRTDDVHGDDRTVGWSTTNPTIGYLTTIAIGKFVVEERLRANGTPIISAFAPGTDRGRAAEERLPEILDFTESLFGPYPFESAGGIYVDTPLTFSLETQTRPVYAPWARLDTVVHETAHQWWGDSVSITSWADICLNECLASYTADYLWPERKDGVDVDARYRKTVVEERGDTAFWASPLFDMGAGREFTAVYSRGPLFLHALRRTIGDEPFFTTLREFPTTHRGGHASMADLRAAFQSRTEIDLGPFFDAWLTSRAIVPEPFLHPGSLAR